MAGDYVMSDYSLGACEGCGKPLGDGDGGVRVDPQGGRWHPVCRQVALAAPAVRAHQQSRATTTAPAVETPEPEADAPSETARKSRRRISGDEQ